ncbi:hypothetical protein [Pseudomonas sp. S4_EA_1b]|uniref:hypothetical protein n=1 Tax=Pseudomonas sp. S4_EA_1b TaxID=2796960 RepID=UPI0018E60F65|nr:hypothetical protein [Pseudomonas sp. S4_EA_1b]MBI6600645.1 hypothetical protein [Pseudomonas sp. S4_EA_1b]
MITDFLNEHDRQLLAHEKGFQDLVLQHMRALPALEWMRFRTIARDNSAWGDAAARSLYKHEEVLHASLNLPTLSLGDLPKSYAAEASVIGQLGGQPVLYFEGTGYYAWALAPETSSILEASITYPAYPPGWAEGDRS